MLITHASTYLLRPVAEELPSPSPAAPRTSELAAHSASTLTASEAVSDVSVAWSSDLVITSKILEYTRSRCVSESHGKDLNRGSNAEHSSRYAFLASSVYLK